MPDSFFFTKSVSITLGKLAEISGSILDDSAHENLIIEDVATLKNARASDISFFENVKYIDDFKTSQAGAIIVHKKYSSQAPKGAALLITKNPYFSYALVAGYFYSENRLLNKETSSNNFVSKSAKIGQNTVIGQGVYIADNVEIGDNCVIHANVNISHAIIGNGVIIHYGACIGQDGFGLAFDGIKYIKVLQLGRVIIEDFVEIGANSCVDRGSSLDTIIGEGSKIDNLVHISHNVKIGKHCVITAQCGIAGSSEIGDYCMMGGQAGIAGHLKIGNGVKIGGQCGVTKDISSGEEITGTPAQPLKQHYREILTIKKLAKK